MSVRKLNLGEMNEFVKLMVGETVSFIKRQLDPTQVHDFKLRFVEGILETTHKSIKAAPPVTPTKSAEKVDKKEAPKKAESPIQGSCNHDKIIRVRTIDDIVKYLIGDLK